MTLRRHGLAALAAVLGTALAASGAQADLPSIYVRYKAEDCTFRVTNDSGTVVTTIAPGTYQVVITTPDPFGVFDLSGRTDLMACKGFVNFRLTGPGINLTTTLEYGDSTFEAYPETFRPGGTYTVQDDVNVAGTRKTITVSTTGSAPAVQGPETGSTAKKPAQLRGTLDASVTAAGKLSLTRNGKTVTSLKAGRYTFSVHDQSRKRGFSIRVVNGKSQPITNGAFFGWRDLTLELTPGRWSFFTPGGAATAFSVVS